MTYVDHYAGPRTQTWGTPLELFARLNDKFAFDLDGAATEDDKLLPDANTADKPVAWTGHRVFCNPPWSNIPPFVEQAATADLAVLLVPARTNCGWFHRALQLGARVEFFKGKPAFRGVGETKGHNSPVDCVLLVFGDQL